MNCGAPSSSRNAVVSGEQAEAFALRQYLPDHGHHRRHADAAGDEENILRARRQAKIVHWRDHRKFIAGLYIVDQAA